MIHSENMIVVPLAGLALSERKAVLRAVKGALKELSMTGIIAKPYQVTAKITERQPAGPRPRRRSTGTGPVNNAGSPGTPERGEVAEGCGRGGSRAAG